MSTSLRYLGKYELQQPLGKGNVGEVWKGYDTQHHRDVAMKILHTDLQSDPHFLTRFTTDGQEMTGLHHSNIVQVHEVNVSRSAQSNEIVAYIAMDYIEGSTLNDYLQQTSHQGAFLSIAQIVYLFTSIGVAIDYAHQKGIVHGNIKPSNILLNKRNTTQFTAGEPMLTDCGFTRFLNNPGSNLSSPHYMSPEQAKGEAPNNRSDVYSLGVILYEICTGVQPFRDESSVAVMMQHINTLPTPPILINPNIPAALSEVILRAMAKDTATRFPMASLLAAAIADACSIQKSAHISLGPGTTSQSEKLVRNTGPLPTSILGVAQPAPIEQPQTPAASNTQPAPVTPMPAISGKLSLPDISGKLPRVTAHMPANPLITNKLPSITLTGKTLVPSTPAQPPIVQQVSPSFTSSHHQAVLPALVSTPAQATAPIQIMRRPARFTDAPVYVVTAALFLVLLVIGSAIGALLIFKGGSPTPVVAQPAPSNIYFQDDALAHSDTLRFQMQNVAAPPQGKSYFAWLQDTKGNTTALGQLPDPQKGSLTFSYPGDAQHTNLLLITQSIFVTLEDIDSNPQSPTGDKIYEATLNAPYFAPVKDILTNTPELPGNQSVVVALFEAIKSMNDKANSIVDSLQGPGPHDYGLVRRQATRIVETIDGTNYARSVGDLPANDPSQLGTRIGLLSSPNQRGYIDLLSLYVEQVKQDAGKDATLLQHVQNVESAITDLKNWVQKMRTYSVHILKAAALTDPAIIGVALQLKEAAADSYTGHTIPPNNGPMPVLGSAGAYQAYIESQYLATLTLQKS
jgi:eukaryotic-like serine/threonine-protein kinase